MARMYVAEPHHHSIAEMVRRVHLLFQQITQEYGHMVSGFTATWSGSTAVFRFTVRGMEVRGNAEVTANQLVITGDAPLIAKGRLESLIRELVQRVIHAPASSLPPEETPVQRSATPKPAPASRPRPVQRSSAVPRPVSARQQRTQPPAQELPTVPQSHTVRRDPFGLALFFTALFQLFDDIVAGGFDLMFGWVFEDGENEMSMEEFDPFKPLKDFVDTIFADDEP